MIIKKIMLILCIHGIVYASESIFVRANNVSDILAQITRNSFESASPRAAAFHRNILRDLQFRFFPFGSCFLVGAYDSVSQDLTYVGVISTNRPIDFQNNPIAVGDEFAVRMIPNPSKSTIFPVTNQVLREQAQKDFDSHNLNYQILLATQPR